MSDSPLIRIGPDHPAYAMFRCHAPHQFVHMKLNYLPVMDFLRRPAESEQERADAYHDYLEDEHRIAEHEADMKAWLEEDRGYDG